jgi:hypothetical protein
MHNEHPVPDDTGEGEGFFLVSDLVPPDQCVAMAERLSAYARGDKPLPEGMVMQREPAVERFGKRRVDGSDIRKVGGIYGDDLFHTLINSSKVADRMRQLVGEGLRLFRADALMKPSGVGSEKGAHQDSLYWPIEPMSLWSCWVPLDDATAENGCMMVIPGSHRGGPRPHEHTQHDYVIPTEHYDIDAMTTVPMMRGTGLFFHSLLIHGTAPNTSQRPRRAITMSFMGGRHSYNGAEPSPTYPSIS